MASQTTTGRVRKQRKDGQAAPKSKLGPGGTHPENLVSALLGDGIPQEPLAGRPKFSQDGESDLDEELEGLGSDGEGVYFDVPISVESREAKAGAAKVDEWAQPQKSVRQPTVTTANAYQPEEQVKNPNELRRDKYTNIILKHWVPKWPRLMPSSIRPPFLGKKAWDGRDCSLTLVKHLAVMSDWLNDEEEANDMLREQVLKRKPDRHSGNRSKHITPSDVMNALLKKFGKDGKTWDDLVGSAL
ncbi:hypothetical protein LTR37_018810 [Vermiconidia calcicola]|uniref:Uncharacterized protein n=1 Tax=Vermiconidia calcicola TaxID=1690605 RepID=A0ACC3MH65_9PEZI|nr:hypothetical protein LTR37_018810 [Vermiconidia calcicola]